MPSHKQPITQPTGSNVGDYALLGQTDRNEMSLYKKGANLHIKYRILPIEFLALFNAVNNDNNQREVADTPALGAESHFVRSGKKR